MTCLTNNNNQLPSTADQPDSQCVPDNILDHGEILLCGLPLQADQEHLDEVPPLSLLARDHLLPLLHIAPLPADEDCHGGQLEAPDHGAHPHEGMYLSNPHELI